MEINKDIIEKAKKLISSAEFTKLIQNTRLNESEISKEKETNDDFKLHMDDGVTFDEHLCREFIRFCLEHLKLKNSGNLIVVLSSDKEKFKTFAFYSIDTKVAAVYAVDRHILDVFRSLAHELVHYKQDVNNEISHEHVSDQNDGVEIENDANSTAGIIMRKFGRLHPELY